MAPNETPSWATKAPYAPPANDFDIKLQGSCHCGHVMYNLSRDKPLASKFCHCNDCKIIHGAPFQWATVFEKEDLSFPNLDTDALKFYNSSFHEEGEGKLQLPHKVACKHCGTWLFDEGRNMILLFPTTIQFKSTAARRKFDVQMHLFYGNRECDIPDGTPKWSGLNEKSDLMDERQR